MDYQPPTILSSLGGMFAQLVRSLGIGSKSLRIPFAPPLWMDVPSAEAPAFAGMTVLPFWIRAFAGMTGGVRDVLRPARPPRASPCGCFAPASPFALRPLQNPPP